MLPTYNTQVAWTLISGYLGRHSHHCINTRILHLGTDINPITPTAVSSSGGRKNSITSQRRDCGGYRVNILNPITLPARYMGTVGSASLQSLVWWQPPVLY